MTYGWDSTTPKHRRTEDHNAIRRAVRRRASGICEWQHVTTALPWLDDAPQCHAYGTDAALYDDGPPHRWAWLCDRHKTALRQAGT